MEPATPTAIATPTASQAGVFERFQGLQVGEQIAVAGIIVTILLAIFGGVRWWIERSERLARERREDERIARIEQDELLAKQADFAFTRGENTRPVSIGATPEHRLLLFMLWNVGMADAALVNVRAFLNADELSPWGNWPSQQNLRVGHRLVPTFTLPFKVEPPGQEDGPRLDEILSDSVVRIDVRFNDASAPMRFLSYCFRFDHVSPPDRWHSREVDCEAA
jgi:hypothetical protein